MTEYESLLRCRRRYANSRLQEISSEISTFRTLDELPNLCIYVTGSYGRLEASCLSDLDLFLVDKDASSNNPISKINKTLLDAELIGATRKLKFPDFSNDAEYLSVHYLPDIKETLGSPNDDFRNHFTARMLLLLESRPVHNESAYNEIVSQIINCYFRDYLDHAESFQPIFLVNDIMRFWRTLCLNYEHRRNQSDVDFEKRNKNHLANLKLKFSRLFICYSPVALLCAYGDKITPESVQEIVQWSPLERLDQVVIRCDSAKSLVSEMKECYAWFLEFTGQDKADILNWIDDETNRKEAFSKGKEFADDMFRLLTLVSKGNGILRYLVV